MQHLDKLWRFNNWRVVASGLVLLFFAAMCFPLIAKSDQGNFSSFPGFKRYFEANPPRATVPTEAQQALLKRFRPRIYLAEGQQAPVDFYADYIASGELYVGGKSLGQEIGQSQLNEAIERGDAEFVYKGALPLKGSATVYGRFDIDILEFQGESWPLEFLSYNLVFPSSGLLAKLPLMGKLGLGMISNLSDWHQLDHYVGLTVVLYQQQPIAFYLQQHNYQTTFLVSEQSAWPTDNRVAVDVALRSNELYRHSASLQRHPGVSFVSEKTVAFVKTGKHKPIMAGWDVTHGQEELTYQLGYLPPSDAFYQFKGRLGKSRKLPGRDGPPGADYVTLPGLMPYANRLVSGYRPASVEREREKIAALFDSKTFTIRPAALDAYKHDFIQAWTSNP